MKLAHRRPLRAAIVLTVQAVFAAGCVEAPADASLDATVEPPLQMGLCVVPPGISTPRGLPCTREGATCNYRTDQMYCGDTPIMWMCRDRTWNQWGSIACNPPAPDVPRERDVVSGIDVQEPVDIPPSDDVPTASDAPAPTDAPLPPADQVRVCPDVRPTEGATCDPDAVPAPCGYPARDPLCPTGSNDMAECVPATRTWRWTNASCLHDPCPAALPAELSGCTLAQPQACIYTVSCGGSLSIRVLAACMVYRDNRVWLHRFPDGLCDGGR